jgi:predicted AlkP superfamily pyrophosphatase or phosphodiesterase
MFRFGLLLTLLAGLAAASPAAAATPRAPVIIISIDGFRADYFDRGLSPTLAALATDGVHAKAMRPSFPSVTEPNHYTLMTGLRPDHHGVVDNMMRDPNMPGAWFGDSGSNVDSDPRWWNEATPLWVSAQRQGLRTASSFWPGDTVIVHNTQPTYLQPHDRKTTMDQQVDAVLGWLDLPAGQRPALIRMHVSAVDTSGHLFGPDSTQVNGEIGKVDAVIGRLVAGLKSRGLYDKTNLIVVSDHGMAAISKVILLDDLIDISHVTVATYGAGGGVNPLPGHEAEIERALLAPHEHMTCWKRANIPANLHYGTNPRVPAIYCLGQLGWSVVTSKGAPLYRALRGDHGYDPAEPTMWALFIAHGPSFRRGVSLPVFDNVDVYPLLARLLDVRPLPNDGHLSEVSGALR